MAKQSYSLGPSPLITIADCAGSLVVQAWDRDEIALKGDNVQTEEKAEGKGLTIQSESDLKLMAPAGASLVIQQAHSDLLIKGIQGHILVEKALADVILRDTGDVDLHEVHADLAAKHMSGQLNVDNVYGDVALRHMGGARLQNVHGDLVARQVDGDIHVGTVHGEARLGPVSGDAHVENSLSDVRMDRVSGSGSVTSAQSDIRLFSLFGPGKHQFNANGDITLRWPNNQPVRILASAQKISNRLNLNDVSEGEGSLSGQIGAGEPETTLVLNAGNRILLKEKDLVESDWVELEADGDDFTFDFDFSRLAGLGERIASRVNERFAQFESQLGSDMATKIERQVEKAVRKAERAAERAARKAERAQRRGYSRTWTVETRPSKAGPAPERSEEQLKVLQMLEQGKISAAEASKLLDALS